MGQQRGSPVPRRRQAPLHFQELDSYMQILLEHAFNYYIRRNRRYLPMFY